MLLMVGKGVTGGIYNAVHRYAKAYNNYMNDYDENKEPSYINYCDVNNLYGFPMMQKLQFNFKWVEDTSPFNEVFIKNYDEKTDVAYILAVDVKHPEEICEYHRDLPFLPKREKIKKIEKLVTSLCDKTEHVFTNKKFNISIKTRITLEKGS